MTAGRLQSLLSSGLPLRSALEHSGTATLSPLAIEAIKLGSPLRRVLSQLDEIELQQQRALAELSQALAVPKATRALLSWLPAFALVASQLMGLSSLSALIHPVSLIAIALGFGLILLGRKLTGSMLVEPRLDQSAIYSLQLFGVAIASGLGLSQTLRRYPELGSSAAVMELVNISKTTGCSLSSLVQSTIQSEITNSSAALMTELRELSVKLLIPLGLTTLPAFLLFTIPPIFIGITNR
jgi:tight adherence protein B